MGPPNVVNNFDQKTGDQDENDHQIKAFNKPSSSHRGVLIGTKTMNVKEDVHYPDLHSLGHRLTFDYHLLSEILITIPHNDFRTTLFQLPLGDIFIPLYQSN